VHSEPEQKRSSLSREPWTSAASAINNKDSFMSIIDGLQVFEVCNLMTNVGFLVKYYQLDLPERIHCRFGSGSVFNRYSFFPCVDRHH